MDASPIYAFAVGNSQALIHTSCGCAFLRNASIGSSVAFEKQKNRVGHQVFS
jgi:hypothetical protein